jgi:hypothetical protein
VLPFQIKEKNGTASQPEAVNGRTFYGTVMLAPCPCPAPFTDVLVMDSEKLVSVVRVAEPQKHSELPAQVRSDCMATVDALHIVWDQRTCQVSCGIRASPSCQVQQ